MALKDYFHRYTDQERDTILNGWCQSENIPAPVMLRAWEYANQAIPAFRVGLFGATGLGVLFLALHATGLTDMGFSSYPILTLIYAIIVCLPALIAMDLDSPLELTHAKSVQLGLLIIARPNLRKAYVRMAYEALQAEQAAQAQGPQSGVE